MKVYLNGQGHMTKMAAMAINIKKPCLEVAKTFVNLFLQNRTTYDFETLPEASVNRALQSVYNHDPRMTLTYLMVRSAEVAYPKSQASVYRTIGHLILLISSISR